MKILIVEDDERLCALLQQTFGKAGFLCSISHSVEEVLKNKYEIGHDLIVLDLVLLGKRGEFLVSELRKRRSLIPIIVLSGLNDVKLKVELLNMGVDDYITKPFEPQELLARIQAVYRRYLEKFSADAETHGDIDFFWRENKVVRGDKQMTLTKKEGALLRFLLQNNGKTVRNEDILGHVWNARVGFHSNVIQSTVRRLRDKIDNGFDHKLITNVHGIGYCLELPDTKK